MKHLLILIALAASAQQIKINPITGLPDLVSTGSGGGCVAGTGITCVGSTISVDTAVIQSRATAQAGTSQYLRSTTGNDTYVGSLTPTLTAYTTGGCLVLNPDTANTGAATVNVDALGAKSILTRTGGALSTGDITANAPITLCYDGTSYVIQGDGGTGTGVTSITCGTGLTGGTITSTGTCDIDTAVVPTKSAANTLAELQTFLKGINIASSTALASAGDIRYNGGDIQYRDGSGPITLMKNPFTTRGDMLIQGASGPTRLAAGTSGYFLMANGAAADPSYQIPNASQVANAFDKSTTNSLGANYFDMTEQAAPSAPGANVARVYAKDDAGTTKVCYQDSAALETCVGAGGGSPDGSGTELQTRGGASTFSALANSSVPNAGELWVGQQAPNASTTRCLFCIGATAWTGGSANGTGLGVTVAGGFTGRPFDVKVGGTSIFWIDPGSTATRVVDNLVVGSSAGAGVTLSDRLLSYIYAGNVNIRNNSASAGSSLTLSGSNSATATDFVAIRGTLAGTSTNQFRINGDQKAVMIGQTVNTTSLSSMSLYVGDRTASGNTREAIEGGGSQSTDIWAVYAYSATPLSGAKYLSVDSAGFLNTQFSTPASSTETCVQGRIKFDANYIYLCTAADTYKRATLSAF